MRKSTARERKKLAAAQAELGALLDAALENKQVTEAELEKVKSAIDATTDPRKQGAIWTKLFTKIHRRGKFGIAAYQAAAHLLGKK